MPPDSLQHCDEHSSNTIREIIAQHEPNCSRTYTPTLAVIAHSAGSFHWTPEGRKLFDYTSGVLVANLGHNPTKWMQRFLSYMGWDLSTQASLAAGVGQVPTGYRKALPLNAYNAVTKIEAQASERLVQFMRKCPGAARMEQVLWAASGSEAIQKALWAALARDRTRQMIIATRHGFHGKKGLAGAVTGTENDRERDPRVRFISFPMKECIDVDCRSAAFEVTPYQRELEALWSQFGRKLGVLITEPYLGGAGSYHPPKQYLQALQSFCRDNDIVFILDEVQANFGRTGTMFAFEKYGLEPDIVVLGKGLANGVPVAAAVGRADLMSSMGFGEGSDTWSGNPLSCAGVLATLDEFESHDVLENARRASNIIEKGLLQLKALPFVAHVRGEKGGMVWGVEMCDSGGKSASQWANDAVLRAYLGKDGVGIHLLGPLANKVLRIAPPLTISETEAAESVTLLRELLTDLLE